MPVTPVLEFGSQLSFGQVSAGSLSHFWSHDNGATYRGETVMGQGNPRTDTFRPLVSVSGAVNGNVLTFVCETTEGQVWIARQAAGRGWDNRRPGT